MYAVKIEAVIPESHHLVLDIPREVPTGHAEILVMPTRSSASGISGALSYLRSNPVHRHSSAEEIEARIASERNSWE